MPGLPRIGPTACTGACDDPSDVEGTDEEKLAAFRRTQLDATVRLRPFIEVSLRAAGRTHRSVLAG